MGRHLRTGVRLSSSPPNKKGLSLLAAGLFVVRGSWFVVRGSWFVVRGSFVESPFFYGKRQTTHGKPKKKETGITAETFKG
ncbi:hypothetical protein [Megasphaera elsdenii]|jgi:hypothetical protein|uniref:hypothetical protein n=1 Tax=Megasphaera elsdenii TaxID=907 RepID=UPI0026DCBADC|nr:hypothetical protein [Megasphaera elsdenii]